MLLCLKVACARTPRSADVEKLGSKVGQKLSLRLPENMTTAWPSTWTLLPSSSSLTFSSPPRGLHCLALNSDLSATFDAQ